MAYTLTDINASLKTILEGVTDIGKVHNRQRWTNNPEQFKLFFMDAAREVINGWFFFRSAMELQITTMGVFRKVHEMTFVGYYSMKDDINTEEIFNTIVEGVVVALSNNFAVTNSWHRMDEADALQVPEIGHDSPGGVLCHTARVTARLEVRA